MGLLCVLPQVENIYHVLNDHYIDWNLHYTTCFPSHLAMGGHLSCAHSFIENVFFCFLIFAHCLLFCVRKILKSLNLGTGMMQNHISNDFIVFNLFSRSTPVY